MSISLIADSVSISVTTAAENHACIAKSSLSVLVSSILTSVEL